MNAVVILAQGCPVGCLGAYGNEWIATPSLDRLAAESIVYDRHIAECPDPAVADRSWWQPGYADAFRHRVLVRSSRSPVNEVASWSSIHEAGRDWLPTLTTVADELDHHDNWLLWIECDHLLPPWSFPKDVFKVYVEDLLENEDLESDIEPWRDPPTGWFDSDDLASWELLHRSHASMVTTFDAGLGRAFEVFQLHGWDRSATWAFTSGRGFALGEHGMIGPHRPWLHEEVVHLPLIVRKPNATDAGERIANLTQPQDLLAMLTGVKPGHREFTVSRWGQETAIRTKSHALLIPHDEPDEEEPRSVQLYDKPKDRWETLDVALQNEETVEEMTALIHSEAR